MNAIRDFLKGKKTYLTAAIGIIGAVIAWADGDITAIGLATSLWAAASTCFIRAAIPAAPQK